MAVLSNEFMTLFGWTSHWGPDGKMGQVAKMLDVRTDIFDDPLWTPASGKTKHTVFTETSMPTINKRSFNEGSRSSQGTQTPHEEGMALFDALTFVDKDLADTGGQKEQLLMREARRKVQAMRQAAVAELLYGNAALDSKGFNGFAVRLNRHFNPGGTNAGNADMVLSAGGTTDLALTSIFLAGWGPDTMHFIFPPGLETGITQADLEPDLVPMFDENNAYTGQMMCYRQKFGLNFGLAVADYRYLGRVCNIEVAHLRSLGNTQALTAYSTNIIHKMMELEARLPERNGINPAYYVNRLTGLTLRRLAMEKSTPYLTIEKAANQFGNMRSFTAFNGIPVRIVDQISNQEALVPAAA